MLSFSARPRVPAVSLPPELISETKIRERVSELAAQISTDYADKGDVVLIGVLKGSFIFLADLSRELTIPRTIEFIAVSSYGSGSVHSGAVRLVMDVRGNIADRHVLIVEDIVDTGHTLKYLISILESLTAGSRCRRLPASQVSSFAPNER